MNHQHLIQRDLKHIWHPCTQMYDFEKFPPFIVEKAQGSYLYTNKGPLIDAISSWWCKNLGHGHPEIIAAIKAQLDNFEHVIGADTTHPKIVQLGEQLAELSGLQHVFFASDGSCAIEIAMKLALESAQKKGYKKRTGFVALKNAYHGETLGASSVSDLGDYKTNSNLGLQCHFLQDVPYVQNINDPLWSNCELYWNKIHQQLEAVKYSVCAILIEPILQGVAGMRMYSADFLYRLRHWSEQNDIYLIADEIMTGLGRTGEWLACQYANIKADMICLSKGLTGGTIPMSCVLIDHEIYDLFYHEHGKGRSFLHSHTFSGNALGVSAALATIKALNDEQLLKKARDLGKYMTEQFTSIASQTGKLVNIRSLGTMVAGDLVPSQNKRLGFHIQQTAIKHGAFFRPLGNTLYWLPPLNTPTHVIEQLAEITLNSIEEVYKNQD